MPKFSNHSLRHTFTTRMCEAGVNVKVMQEILGHADIEVTMNIYAEATKEFTVEEMINLESYFDSKMVKIIVRLKYDSYTTTYKEIERFIKY